MEDQLEFKLVNAKEAKEEWMLDFDFEGDIAEI